MYDFLRRKGLEKAAEMLAQEAQLTTEQLSSGLKFVASVSGGSSSKNGFLMDFWGIMWENMLAKSAAGGQGGTPPLQGVMAMMGRPSSVQSVPIGQPTLSPVLPAAPQGYPPPQPISPQIDLAEVTQRARLNMAMSMVGLAGRDPASLNPVEKNSVMNAFRSIAMPTPAMATPSAVPSPSLGSQAPPSAQQQLLQYQMMLQHQQQQNQLLYQQYQQLMSQQRSFLQVPGAVEQQQVLPRRTSAGTNTQQPKRKLSTTFDNAQIAPPPVSTRTNPEILGSPKRVRSASNESLSPLSQCSSDEHVTSQYFNMPDVDDSQNAGAEAAILATKKESVQADLQLLASFDQVYDKRISSVHISSDARLMASAGRDGKIAIFDLHAKKLIGVLPVLHSERVSRAWFAQAGWRRYLLTGGSDKALHLWDFGDAGSSLVELPTNPVKVISEDHSALIVSVEISNKLNSDQIDVIASCDTEGVLVIRSLAQDQVLHKFSDKNHSAVKAMAFEPQGDSILALAIGDKVDFYDWRQEAVVYTIKAPNGKHVNHISWAPGLILLTTDTELYGWSLDFGFAEPIPQVYNGRLVAKFQGRGENINCSCIINENTSTDPLQSKQNRLVAIGGWKKIFLWRINYDRQGGKTGTDERGNAFKIDAHHDLVSSLASATGSKGLPFVVSGGYDCRVMIWSVTRVAVRPSAPPSQVHDPAPPPAYPPFLPNPSGFSSVDELGAINFDPISMFLDSNELA